jgi:hypothetical protein
MTDKKQKLLQSQGRAREQAPATGKSGGFLSIHELQDGKLKLTAREYVNRFGTDEDFERVQEVIMERRKQEPAFSYWKCENPHCLWKAKMNGDKKESFPCLKCNAQRFKDGSWMKQMSKAEAEQFEKSEAERERADVRRLQDIAYNADTEDRKKSGLPARSREEFLAEREATGKA